MVTFNVDSLDFDTDEEARFGASPDFGMRYEGANSRLELEDRTNGAVSHFPQNTRGDIVDGLYAETVAEGKVLASDGNVYEDIREAVNNATSWAKAGPGTFYNQPYITDDSFLLVGSGKRTILKGGGRKTCVKADANDVMVRGMTIQSSEGKDGIGFSNGTGDHYVMDCLIEDCRYPILGNGSNRVQVLDNTIRNCTNRMTLTLGSNHRVLDNTIKNIGNRGVYVGDNSIVAYNIVKDSGDPNKYGAITLWGESCICYANRVINAGGSGIYLNAGNNVVVNNRISGSQRSAIDDDGSGSTIQDNIAAPEN